MLFPTHIPELDTLIFNKLDDKSFTLFCCTNISIGDYCDPIWKLRYQETFPHLYQEYKKDDQYSWHHWYIHTTTVHGYSYCVFTMFTEAVFGCPLYSEYYRCVGICDNIIDAYNIFASCILPGDFQFPIKSITDIANLLSKGRYKLTDCYIRRVKMPYEDNYPAMKNTDLVRFCGDPWTTWLYKSEPQDDYHEIKFSDKAILKYQLNREPLPSLMIGKDFLVQNTEYSNSQSDEDNKPMIIRENCQSEKNSPRFPSLLQKYRLSGIFR